MSATGRTRLRTSGRKADPRPGTARARLAFPPGGVLVLVAGARRSGVHGRGDDRSARPGGIPGISHPAVTREKTGSFDFRLGTRAGDAGNASDISQSPGRSLHLPLHP